MNYVSYTMNSKLWHRVQYWKDKYNNTPNGWPVAHLIGAEYQSAISKVSNSKRNTLGKGLSDV